MGGEACGVGVRRGVARGVRSQVVGMATSHGAREETGARTRRVSGARASGAGDAVNGKYEKKTMTLDAPRYQVVLVDFEIQMTMIVVVAVIMRF